MNQGGFPEITDPVYDPDADTGIMGRVFHPLIRDHRDLPFVQLALWLTVLLVPLGIFLLIPGNFRWWLAVVYWAFYTYYLGPYILMLHNTSHRILFKRKYRLLNSYIPWVVGPFLGLTPGTYHAHHLGMHHVENNLPDDLSSTMKYQRDSFVDFLKYYLTFLVGSITITRYFIERRRHKILRRFWSGEATFLLVTAVLLVINWKGALVVFAGPLLFTRLMLMSGNWGQHAFIDPDDPTNDYRTVITFINSSYNHRCFNDGYHLGHHLKATRHWLDMPQDFLDKRQEMIRQNSLVFRELDYFMIFVLLMLKQKRRLARYYVDLDPENPKSEQEILALFERRLRRFPAEQLDQLRA